MNTGYVLEAFEIPSGDLVYVSDRRWWTGGMKSAHAVVGEVVAGDEEFVTLGPDTFRSVVVPRRRHRRIVVERLY